MVETFASIVADELKKSPVWKTMSIDISISENNIIFSRNGRISISMPSQDVMTFGAVKIYKMFKMLDEQL